MLCKLHQIDLTYIIKFIISIECCNIQLEVENPRWRHSIHQNFNSYCIYSYKKALDSNSMATATSTVNSIKATSHVGYCVNCRMWLLISHPLRFNIGLAKLTNY